MKTTSNFIAIPVDALKIAPVFIKLQQFFKEKNIEACFELQNPLSVHITLYYFENDICDVEKIKKDLSGIGIQENICIEKFSYFQKNSEKIICYLEPKTQAKLEIFFDYFHKKYKNQAFENSLVFTPHITLFHVLDTEAFKQYQGEIEDIIQKFLKQIKNKDVCGKNLALYAVNSHYKPQLQIMV